MHRNISDYIDKNYTLEIEYFEEWHLFFSITKKLLKDYTIFLKKESINETIQYIMNEITIQYIEKNSRSGKIENIQEYTNYYYIEVIY